MQILIRRYLSRNTYKVAIAGCGMAGSGYDISSDVLFPRSHAGAYIRDNRFKLVAAADISQESLRCFGRKWDVSNLYFDVEEMLAKESIDVLSIASSTDSHVHVLRQALKSSVKMILIEKPIGYSYSKALSLLPEVEKSKKVIMVNYFRRLDKNNIVIREWIRKGRLGKLVKSVMYYTVGIIHNGSHGIDLMQWYFGEIDRVMGITLSREGEDHLIDACYVLKNNGIFFAHGFLRGNCNIMEIDLLMEKGRIRILRGGRIIEFMSPQKDPDFPRLKVFEHEVFPYESDWQNSMINTVNKIYEILEHRKKAYCSYYDGVMAMGWAEKAVESATNGNTWMSL